MLNLRETHFHCAIEESAVPVIVKFHAGWCADCRRIEDSFDAFPEKYPGALFAAVDVEANPALAEQFDVKGIPSILVFRNGRLTDRLNSRDARTVRQVEEFVAKQLIPSQAV